MKIEIDPTDFFFTEKYSTYKRDRSKCLRKIIRHLFWFFFFYLAMGTAVYALQATEQRMYAYFFMTCLALTAYCGYVIVVTVADILFYRNWFVMEFKFFLKSAFKQKTASH